MDRATSRFRIGMMFSLIGLTVLGSVMAIRAGKRDRAAHINSLAQKNRERHAKLLQASDTKHSTTKPED